MNVTENVAMNMEGFGPSVLNFFQGGQSSNLSSASSPPLGVGSGPLNGLSQTAGGIQQNANRLSSASSVLTPIPTGRQSPYRQASNNEVGLPSSRSSSASSIFIPIPTAGGSGVDLPALTHIQAIASAVIPISAEVSHTSRRLNVCDVLTNVMAPVLFTGTAFYLSWFMGDAVRNAPPEQKNALTLMALASSGVVLGIGGTIYLLKDAWRMQRENNNASPRSPVEAQDIELGNVNA